MIQLSTHSKMKQAAANETHQNTMMGYNSITDWLSTCFGAIGTKLGGVMIALASTLTFLTGYIYDTPHAVYTLWFLYAFDFVTALVFAWKEGTISSRKLPRVLLNVFVITSLLSLSWWMSKSLWVFVPLPAVVIAVSYSTLFISIVENLAKLKALPPGLLQIINRRFSTSVIERKIFQDENDQSVES